MTKSQCYILLSFSTFCSSCNLGFYFKEHIVGQYYLVAMDSKDQLNIAYRNGARDDYSGRVPPTVTEFGYSDSLLVAKSIINVREQVYYIIKIREDSATARPETYLIGPLSEREFLSLKTNIKLRKVREVFTQLE
jgi:hypothetical protein